MNFEDLIKPDTPVKKVADYISRTPGVLEYFDTNNESLLICSIKNANHPVTLFLLEKGADANRYMGVKTPLLLAVKEWDDEVIKRLLEETSEESYTGVNSKYSIMAEIIAFRSSEKEAVHQLGILLENGFKPDEEYRNNSSSSNKDSILSYTCGTFGEPSKIVELFIKAGANVNHVNIMACNPLYFAISRNRQTIFDLLIRNGARILPRNMKSLSDSGNYHWLEDKLDYLTKEEKSNYDEYRLIELFSENKG